MLCIHIAATPNAASSQTDAHHQHQPYNVVILLALFEPGMDAPSEAHNTLKCIPHMKMTYSLFVTY